MVNYSFKLYDFKDKERALRNSITDMYKITLNMFEWKNLPSTIPAVELEKLLQMRGSCIIAQHEGNLYALGGNLSGDCDAYYIPKFYIVANPWLKLNRIYERNVDCVFCKNDSMMFGINELMEKYGTLSLETDLSINICNIMERLHTLMRCANDSEKVAFESLLNRIERGELASAIVSDSWLMSDGIGTLPFADNGKNSITQLIELRQYIKAGWYNDIGLQANYNMKREAINSTEGQLNEDGLLPLVADMLKNREEIAENINDMFGTDVSVELSGAWKAREVQTDATIEQYEEIAEGTNNDSTEENTDNSGIDTERDIPEDSDIAERDGSVDGE